MHTFTHTKHTQARTGTGSRFRGFLNRRLPLRPWLRARSPHRRRTPRGVDAEVRGLGFLYLGEQAAPVGSGQRLWVVEWEAGETLSDGRRWTASAGGWGCGFWARTCSGSGPEHARGCCAPPPAPSSAPFSFLQQLRGPRGAHARNRNRDCADGETEAKGGSLSEGAMEWGWQGPSAPAVGSGPASLCVCVCVSHPPHLCPTAALGVARGAVGH